MKEKAVPEPDLFKLWVEFNKAMTARFDMMSNEDFFGYEDMMKSWAAFNNKINSDVLHAFKDGDKAKEAAKIMKKFNDEIEKTIAVCTKDDTEACQTKVYRTWSNYSSNMGKMIMDILYSKIREQNELYELWMDSYGMRGEEKGKSGATPFDFAMENMDNWSSLMGTFGPKMTAQDFSGDFQEKMKSAQENWSREYAIWMKEMMKTPAFALWAGQMVERTAEEKIRVNRQVEQNLRYMGFPTQSDLDGIRRKLFEIEKNMLEIRSSLRTTPQGKEK